MADDVTDKEVIRPAYYAIIPANLRYDKNLIPNAKLLYGEITALTNEKGYCWASNKYFSDLYSTTERTVQRWIKDLCAKNYINIKFTYKAGSKEIQQRYIYLGGDKKVTTCGDKNVAERGDKNVVDNTTVITNTTLNIYTNEFELFWASYPELGYQNSKPQSFKNFKSLVKKKISADSLIQAAKNYATDCKTEEKTDFVYKASNFVGRNEYYKSYIDGVWVPAKPKDKPVVQHQPSIRELDRDKRRRLAEEYDRNNSERLSRPVLGECSSS